jgi:hypothetical protein
LKFFRKFATLLVPILLISLAGGEGVDNFEKEGIADPTLFKNWPKHTQHISQKLNILLCLNYHFHKSFANLKPLNKINFFVLGSAHWFAPSHIIYPIVIKIQKKGQSFSSFSLSFPMPTQNGEPYKQTGHLCVREKRVKGIINKKWLALATPRKGYINSGRNSITSIRSENGASSRRPTAPAIKNEAMQIIIPQTWRPIKSITITFTILLIIYNCSAELISDSKLTSFSKHFSRPNCPFTNNNFRYFAFMPRGSLAQTKRDLKRGREKAYILTFGRPCTLEEQDYMDQFVNSDNDIPRPNNSPKMFHSIMDEGVEDQQNKPGSSTNPQNEDMSGNHILPLTTQVEIEQQQSKYTKLPKQQQTQPTTPPINSTCNATTSAITTKKGQTGGVEGLGLEEKLASAFVACMQKFANGQPFASPPSALTVKVGQNEMNQPIANLQEGAPALFSAPRLDLPTRAIPLSKQGNGPRQYDPRRPHPYDRRYEHGRRPNHRQAHVRSATAETHLRNLRVQAEQLSRAAGIARAEVEQEHTHDFLAIEGGITLVLKSIRKAFSRLPPR